MWAPRARVRVHLAELDGPAGATPLVLLHPWGLSMRVWSDVAPALAEDRRVLLVDLPAHGKSGKPHAAYPMARLAAAVLDAMDAAGIRRAVLAGNSLGGATALAVAERAPARVEAVIPIAAPGGDAIWTPLVRAAGLWATPEACASLTAEAWWLGFRVVERSSSPLARALRDEHVALRGAEEWPAWCRATLTVLRSVATYAPDLEQIEAPALVVGGGSDPLITPAMSQALAERLPRGRLAMLEGCGHLPQVECPAALLERVRRFLNARGAGPGSGAATAAH